VVPFQIGVSGQSSLVSAVRKGSPAEQEGVTKGDRVVSLNGAPVSSWVGFSNLLGEAKTAPIQIEIERGGARRTISLGDAGESAKTALLQGIAVQPGLVVAEVVEGSPAAKAGLRPGDLLLQLGTTRLRTWAEFASLVRDSQGRPIRLAWERAGKRVGPVTITPAPNEKAAFGEVGLAPLEERVLRRYGFWKSCTVGTHKAVVNVVRIYYTITGFVTGTISPRNLGSIILIAQATYQSAMEGLGRLLYFLGFVGINLAVLNLLPIPILDGGHLVFLLLEKIKGSPVKERTMAIAQYAGLAILVGLILFAMGNDLWRIFGWS
jgi:regulator of sigma E protease